MLRVQSYRRGLLTASSGWCLFMAAMAHAQTPPAAPAPGTSQLEPSARDGASADGDIVVTARKRGETLIGAPVTITAVTSETLATRGITNLEGFARLVPQLFLANSSGSFQGGALGLRGISAGDGNVFGDQAVAFNIDGVQIARSTPRQLSEFDLQQIEVLKGPQALYFGKNSPGGIVVIHTADPTDHFEAGVKGNYEFNAHEWRGEAFVSGPLTDTLGARVAVTGSTMRGWVTNIATPGTIYSPADTHEPGTSDFGTRLTLKYNDSDRLTARFKFNYGERSDNGIFSNTQRVYCPLGTPQLGGPDDCTPDNRVDHTSLGTRFGSGGANTVSGAAIPGVYLYGDGTPYSRTKQMLSGLELGYKLSDNLQLASNTGYYDGHVTAVDNVNQADALFPYNPAAGAAGVGGILASYADLKIREISEEARLTSSFSGPLNFMVGGYYQDQKLSYVGAATVNALNPIQLFPPITLKQDGTAYSFFGSLNFKPTSTIELSGGARYSHEEKDYSAFRLLPGTLGGVAYVSGEEVPTTVPKRAFHNVSPEVTLSWRPTSRFTAYASWKRGFLSGGFNATGTTTGVARLADNSYNQEVVQGFEGGVKVNTLQGKLRLNLAAYSYKISGLQVTVNLPGPPTIQLVNNAASARSKGVEGDFNLQTPLNGLSVHGTIAYNDAHYSSFTGSPCYGGQTISMGCNGGYNGTVYTTQNLSGRPLVRAPKWAGAIGAAYELKTASGGTFGINADGNYTSSFFTDTLDSPGSLERAYWLLDASTHYAFGNGMDVAFIGRNLTNKYYFQRSSAAPLTGGKSGVATSIMADQVAYVSRGRELRIQFSYRF
jgi:iron complex outermembrane receptor protein